MYRNNHTSISTSLPYEKLNGFFLAGYRRNGGESAGLEEQLRGVEQILGAEAADCCGLNTMLCYAMLYYTILYYTILYYTILYNTILYYTI